MTINVFVRHLLSSLTGARLSEGPSRLEGPSSDWNQVSPDDTPGEQAMAHTHLQKQQAPQRLHAEGLNSCFSDDGALYLYLSRSLSARAAESAHQINTGRGIVFPLETADQVTDNGNTCRCGCKEKAIPMQTRAGASLKPNAIFGILSSRKNRFNRRKDGRRCQSIPQLPDRDTR